MFRQRREDRATDHQQRPAGGPRRGLALEPPSYGIALADRPRPATSPVVQAKCACGGTCSSCQGKSDGSGEKPASAAFDPRGFAPPSPAAAKRRGAGAIPFGVQAPRVAPNAPATTVQRFRGMLEAMTAEIAIGGRDEKESGPEGEAYLLTTGGYSQCNLGGDAPRIVNNNDEATRECTQEHEEYHVADWGPCCTTARAAYQADGADRGAVMTAWNAWINTNRAYFECGAYPVSVSCANRLWGSENCDTDATTEACTQIASYRTNVSGWRDHFCGQGGSDAMTDCPSF